MFLGLLGLQGPLFRNFVCVAHHSCGAAGQVGSVAYTLRIVIQFSSLFAPNLLPETSASRKSASRSNSDLVADHTQSRSQAYSSPSSPSSPP